ncbi:hypothetical protein M409DRAFT_30954 [Zasmidium cellare ATCC 36951]|uniref:non-specific serine/threonine protein kinase n=1 Tax=Zasmidium cellare ATCC 36951 TaxID=1080233 RepID=A0A6A6BWY0_ZASCE|nr:uncharacterized protein M409DRAFT_30954 [Zasmidium cellare ATCC 36951]KAF2158548.1 hypothetical protein M409DRAFT_30954 [Zasmidium cellare ATCC 36951]
MSECTGEIKHLNKSGNNLYNFKDLLELCSGPVIQFPAWHAKYFNQDVEKIAEAAFAEVYRFCVCDTGPRDDKFERSALKIIPLRSVPHISRTSPQGQNEVILGQSMMSDVQSVTKEIRTMQALSPVSGFTQLRDVRVIQGRPTLAFVNAHRSWDRKQKACGKTPSLFPDPACEASYSDLQLWAVLEMEYAGHNLEEAINNGECDTVCVIWDVFWQICQSVARAEQSCDFEHRDLHPGNICIQPRALHSYVTPLRTTIIDYGLSRCTLPNGDIISHDLSKVTGLFDGDGTRAYQYDIYRYMRCLILGNATDDRQDSEMTWRTYRPESNLLWLHLILTLLMQRLPATDANSPYVMRTYTKNTNEMRGILWQVHEVLQPWQMREMSSASDLMEKAMSENWLDLEYVGDMPLVAPW